VSSFSPARLVIKDCCASSLTKPGSLKVLVFPEIRDACSPVDADSRGTIQVLDRPGLEKASCECCAIVKERFDAFLTPPSAAAPGHNKSRSDQVEKD